MAAKRRGTEPRHVTSEELETAVRALVERASGLAGSEFKRELGKDFKGHDQRALEVASELASRGQLYRWSSARKVRYFRHDPVAAVAEMALAVLAEGPLTEGELKKRVEARNRGLGDLVKEWLKGALARGDVFVHVPLPRSKTKRFGRRPDVAVVLNKVLVELRKALGTAAGRRLERDLVAQALARELGVTLSSAQRAEPAERTDREVLLDALARLAEERAPQSLLLVRELRARTSFDKERFDSVVLDLEREGLITLHHHDFPAALSPAERAELVSDGRGTHYVGIALRRHR